MNALDAEEPLEPNLFQRVPFEGAVGYRDYRENAKPYSKGFGMFQCYQGQRYWRSAQLDEEPSFVRTLHTKFFSRMIFTLCVYYIHCALAHKTFAFHHCI